MVVWQLIIFIKVEAQRTQLLAESQNGHSALASIANCVVGKKQRTATALVKGFHVVLFDIAQTSGIRPAEELAEILGDRLGEILYVLVNRCDGVMEILVRILQQHRNRHGEDRKSTRLNSSHVAISYAVFCL